MIEAVAKNLLVICFVSAPIDLWCSVELLEIELLSGSNRYVIKILAPWGLNVSGAGERHAVRDRRANRQIEYVIGRIKHRHTIGSCCTAISCPKDIKQKCAGVGKRDPLR